MSDEQRYPYNEGDTVVLGPETFASSDGRVICWRGENYTPQSGPQLTAAEARFALNDHNEVAALSKHWQPTEARNAYVAKLSLIAQRA